MGWRGGPGRQSPVATWKRQRTKGRLMGDLSELPITDLRTAGDAIETLIEFRAYLPPEEVKATVCGRFRDDIRELLGLPIPERAERGYEERFLPELDDEGFNHLLHAVGTLVGRFTPFMDDPELVILLKTLHDLLTVEEARRDALKAAELKEEVTVS